MIHYKAPATLMLMGEHAVLEGYPAIGCAVDQYISCKLKPRKDQTITIYSALGTYQASIDNLIPHKKFTFIIESIRQFIPYLETGFDLKIASEFSSTIGFGSSAAITITILSCLKKYAETNHNLIKIGKKVIRSVQKRGSGMDLITSLTGGIVYYNPPLSEITRISDFLPLHAIYSGYKTPTATVLHLMQSYKEANPSKFMSAIKIMAKATKAAKKHIEDKDFKAIGEDFNQAQSMFRNLRLNCQKTIDCANHFRSYPKIYGTKISGSGLGDCIIGIGQIDQKLIQNLEKPYLYLPIKCDTKGCHEVT